MRIAALLLSAALVFTGCAKNTTPSVPPAPNDPVISALTIAFGAIPIASATYTSYMKSYYADGKITKAELNEYTKWNKNALKISTEALKVLQSDESRAGKILAVVQIVNDYQKPVILKTMSPEAKAAYMAINAAFDAALVQLAQTQQTTP